MNSWLKYAIFLMGMVQGSWAYGQPSYTFSDAAQQQQFERLTQEFRCPKCQNQNLADSNAAIAVDLKNKTYALIVQGQSDAQIRDYMIARYGYFISYKPPMTRQTMLLWSLPVFVLVLGLVIMIGRRLRPKQHAVPALSAVENEQLQQLRQQYLDVDAQKNNSDSHDGASV